MKKRLIRAVLKQKFLSGDENLDARLRAALVDDVWRANLILRACAGMAGRAEMIQEAAPLARPWTT